MYQAGSILFRNRIVILLFSLFLIIEMSFVHAEEVCVVKPAVETMSDRVRVIKTQDGRTITIIGHNHGDRMTLRSIREIVNYKSDSNDLWLWSMKSVLNSSKSALQNFNEEVVFLSEYLKKNPEIKFIGLESTPQTAEDHLKYSEKVRDDLLTESSRRKISNFSTSPYLLGFAGSAVYLKLVKPGLMRNRIFFGAESEHEAELHGKALDKYDVNLKKLMNQIDVPSLEGQDFLLKIQKTEGELLALYTSYKPSLDDKILKSALAKTPDKYKKATSDWLLASLEEMKVMKKRDEKIAESLLSQDGSSLMTIGLAHLDSVASILTKKCRQTPAAVNKTENKIKVPSGVQ